MAGLPPKWPVSGTAEPTQTHTELPARLVFSPCEMQPGRLSKFYDLSGKYCQTLPVSLGWLSQDEKTRGTAGLVWCQTLPVALGWLSQDEKTRGAAGLVWVWVG